MDDFFKILDAMWNMQVIEHIPHTNIEEYVYNLLFQNHPILADQIKHINGSFENRVGRYFSLTLN